MKKEIGEIGRELILTDPVEVVEHPNIQKLCRCPYPDHPEGCPNWGKKEGCPPGPYYGDMFEAMARLAIVKFDFGEYLEAKREQHPDWTERALRNPRHWQGHLRAAMKQLTAGREYVISSPEGMGVNVTATCKRAGIILEWPPENYVCQVNLIATPKKRLGGETSE
jgi:hypothetical protein